MRRLAQDYGVSEDSVRRHKKKCVPELIKEAYARGLAERGASLVERLEGHLKRIEAKLDLAESEENHWLFLGIMKEVRAQIQLLGQFTQQLESQPRITLNISPEWIEVRSIILTTLEEKHSEALDDLVLALEGTEATLDGG
jgi:hypothetical protein